MIRREIRELQLLGPLPDSSADETTIERHEQLLSRIQAPVTDDEAKLLVRLFGPDDCYGLAWTLLHLIETAPGWPIEESLEDRTTEWIARMRRAAGLET